jgi:hypothetical protein
MTHTYDAYLNGRNELPVVPSGLSIPSELAGTWRKKKRSVRSVSDQIKFDIDRRGYHCRRLIDRFADIS